MTDDCNNNNHEQLLPWRVGIDTHQEPVVYMRADCPLCRSEGFDAQSRVIVRVADREIIATLNVVHGNWLWPGKVGFSEAAWQALQPADGVPATFAHPPAVESMSDVRAKIYGHEFNRTQLERIVQDIARHRYSDVELSAFVTACGGNRMSLREITALTEAMIGTGERLSWPAEMIVDKHCIGGLPGNRTTPLVVAIVTCHDLLMPKTSSRAITSPAGTADTMEMLAPVALSVAEMRSAVEREGGCIAWGGAVHLSPADDIMIRIERALELDSEGQLVASILSKKAAAGATHVVMDLPVGATAKVRSDSAARSMAWVLAEVGRTIGIEVRALLTDGSQPVGDGIGPALEAHDILAVLQEAPDAPSDLRSRAVTLAGAVLEMAGKASEGEGAAMANATLRDGRAWRKFQAICEAQGGMRTPPRAQRIHVVPASRDGVLMGVDNRKLARIAKLAGAPASPSAGLRIRKRLGDAVRQGETLFELHAESRGELQYALDYINRYPEVFQFGEPA